MNATTLTHVRPSDDGRRLLADWGDGARTETLCAWLFDNAVEAVEPGSGQRLHGALALDGARSIAHAAIVGGHVVLRFSPGGDARRIGIETLRLAAAPPVDRFEPWLTPEPIAVAAPIAFDDYLTDDDCLREALDRVGRHGIVFLTAAGDRPGAVEQAVRRFGFVRETNYGRTFDVRIEARPSNLAFTARGLDLHTDNPYRDPTPTLQLLHAIATSTDGGESQFVDGFAHAQALAREAPAFFERLSAQPACFRFTGPAGDRYEAAAPIIETTPDGRVKAIRLNHRSLGAQPMAPDVLEAWYEAYLAFYRRLHADAARFERRLATGDLVIFDNRRILHGRSAFRAGGALRWFEGCYADRDGLLATLARLEGRAGR